MTQAPSLIGQTQAFGALWPAPEFYSPPLEVIEAESSRDTHGHCNVIHNESMMRADVYFAGSDEFIAWALGRRVLREVQREAVLFAPVEYVIVNKLQYFRMGKSDRHLRDVARMVAVSGPEIDQRALDDWIARLDLAAEWQKARAFEGGDG